MKLFLGIALVISVVLNALLWNRLSRQADHLRPSPANTSEMDALRQRNQELQGSQAKGPDVTRADTIELARLRNEVAQLRRNTGDPVALRSQEAELGRLQTELAKANQRLAEMEREVAEVAKLSPDQLQELKEDAQSIRCVNHMKQIGLAARMWANDHQDVFPPDFISMTNELSHPKILFCPADSAALTVTEWSQLNPSTISYRLLNPNGDMNAWTNRLIICPIHGHFGLSDGSVHRR